MSSHRNHVLDGGAHWRHLANTIERSVRGGDAVLCQNVCQLVLIIGPIDHCT